jgi:chorismate mutase
MLDTMEIDVPGALPCCLRVLVLVDRASPVKPAYLRGARALRPDLAEDDDKQMEGEAQS